ncbi:MAG: GHMP kinase [Dehalococcoidales bacterium]|nr:GHMP kinase [Dehalococcoidales bacterium]
MIIVQTPLRISFLGGGTDFEDYYRLNGGGAVLTTAINKHTFVIVKERFDNMIYVNYSRKEIVERVEDLQHELIKEAMKLTGVEKGVEITTLADIPSEGTGLGSSSSILVGLLLALHTYQGDSVTSEILAREACQIEIDTLKKPIGKQDQYIAAYGNMRFITFKTSGIDVGKLGICEAEKQRFDEHLLLFYTGRTRQADPILAEQKSKIEETKPLLAEMTKLAYRGKDALSEQAYCEFGELLHEGWKIKKQFASRVTDAEIDDAYEVARQAGAIGGKIAGAGGGGFMLLCCPPSKRDDVRSSLRGLREFPFRSYNDGSKVIFNYRN